MARTPAKSITTIISTIVIIITKNHPHPQHHDHDHHQQLSGHENRHKVAGKLCQVNYRHVHIPLLPLQCHSCLFHPSIQGEIFFSIFVDHFVNSEYPKWSNLLKDIFNDFFNSEHILVHIFEQAIKTKLLFRSRKMLLKLASEFWHPISITL